MAERKVVISASVAVLGRRKLALAKEMEGDFRFEEGWLVVELVVGSALGWDWDCRMPMEMGCL